MQISFFSEDTLFSEAFTSSEAIKLRSGVTNQQNWTKAENRKSKDRDPNGIEVGNIYVTWLMFLVGLSGWVFWYFSDYICLPAF